MHEHQDKLSIQTANLVIGNHVIYVKARTNLLKLT
jgi:hypothetical protein